MIEEMYKEEFGDSSEDSNPLGGCALAADGVTDHEEDWLKFKRLLYVTNDLVKFSFNVGFVDAN